MAPKVSLITESPHSLFALSIKAFLIREGITHSVDTVSCSCIEQLNSKSKDEDDKFSEYYIVVFDSRSKAATDIILKSVTVINVPFVFFLIHQLSYQQIREYSKVFKRAAFIDHNISALELGICMQALRIKSYVFSSALEYQLLGSMESNLQPEEICLTDIEKRVIELYHEGYHIDGMAELLCLRKHTVQAIRSSILKKCKTYSMKRASQMFK